MPPARPILLVISAVLAFAWSLPRLRAQPVYTVQTLANQIPAGDQVLASAATTTPAGVQIVGTRRFHNGGNENTPVIFPTATSAMQIMQNPPSDSTYGNLSAATYVPSLGVIEGGSYFNQHSSQLSVDAALWNGTPNSGVDIALRSFSGVSGLSAAPAGFQAVGSGRFPGNTYSQALMWTGPTPQSAQLIQLGNTSIMKESYAVGAYTFNGVAKQVGYSYDLLPDGSESQPRARVWAGSAASVIDLTPTGYLSAAIKGGNGDGLSELLCGSVSHTSIYDADPTIWTGTSGAFRTLATTPDLPAGDVVFCTQTSGVGELIQSTSGGIHHAVIWDLATGAVTDLHNFLPPELQVGGSVSTAFYEDPFGNIYGQATANGSSYGVPVVWLTSVPEPSSLSLMVVAALTAWVGRRRIRGLRRRGPS
jgi:hypothetical protein